MNHCYNIYTEQITNKFFTSTPGTTIIHNAAPQRQIDTNNVQPATNNAPSVQMLSNNIHQVATSNLQQGQIVTNNAPSVQMVSNNIHQIASNNVQLRKQEVINSAPKHQVQRNQQTIPQPRTKRQLGLMAGMVTGAFVSNIWTTVREGIWGNDAKEDLKNHLKTADILLGELNQNTNITKIKLKAIEESIELNAKLAEANIERINHF